MGALLAGTPVIEKPGTPTALIAWRVAQVAVESGVLPEGDAIFVVRTMDERDEARLVVRGVRELMSQGQRLSDVVVFYRTHAQSRVIEEALRGANLGYRIVGGMRFYDRAEVKDLLGYLRVMINPADDMSLLRIINTPARGIGPV